MDVAAVVLLCAGAVLLFVARKSYDGTLPPNGVAGLRTSATARSEAAWYAGQRASAPAMLIAGWVSTAGGVITVALIVFDADDPLVITIVAAAAAIMLGAAFVGSVVGNRAARAAPDDDVRGAHDVHPPV